MKKSYSLNNLEELESVGKYKINLVLDLDNTIIYTYALNCETEQDLIKKFTDKNDKRLLISFDYNGEYYFVFERLYLDYFIMFISNYFNIYIYTNGQKNYHDIIVDSLVEKYPMLKIINSMYKTSYEDLNIKKLEKLDIESLYNKNYFDHDYKSNTIIIDDRDDIWPFDLQNLIKILPYYDIDKEDDDLLFISDILSLLNQEYNKIIKKNRKFSIQVLLNKLKSFYNI